MTAPQLKTDPDEILVPERYAKVKQLVRRIRRIARSKQFVEDQHDLAPANPDDKEDTDLTDAVCLLRHLRPNRVEEAEYAHRQLARRIIYQLRTEGGFYLPYTVLVEELFFYLDEYGAGGGIGNVNRL